MNIETIKLVTFSPTGNSAKVAKSIAGFNLYQYNNIV